MNTSSSIHVGAVLFESFELLDFFGPLELFGLLEGAAKITVLAEKTGVVKSSSIVPRFFSSENKPIVIIGATNSSITAIVRNKDWTT